MKRLALLLTVAATLCLALDRGVPHLDAHILEPGAGAELGSSARGGDRHGADTRPLRSGELLGGWSAHAHDIVEHFPSLDSRCV
jgi:hypothetical protein